MHLLAVQPGGALDGEEAVDLGQSPGDIVILSAADSDLTCLARAAADLPVSCGRVRLANMLKLRHPLSVDMYVEQVIAGAKFVCVRLLGGRSYWPYGLDEFARTCRQRGVVFVPLLDEQADDPDAGSLTQASMEVRERVFGYLRHGGVANARNLLLYAAALTGLDPDAAWGEPAPVLDAGLYWPGLARPRLEDVQALWTPGAPVAALTFYRALVTAGATEVIDAHIAALQAQGLNPLPIYVQSLKSGFAAELITTLFDGVRPDVVLNATAFAVSPPGDGRKVSPLERADAAVLQLVFAATDRESWAASARGLSARDLAMNVALPEVDGRILAGATAFKSQLRFDERTEWASVIHEADDDRLGHAARMAAGWARLKRTPAGERNVALVVANYPNRDARLGNGRRPGHA